MDIDPSTKHERRETAPRPWREVSSIKISRAACLQGARAIRDALLKAGYFLSSAIIIPYCIWVYFHEYGSFSRIPVTAGILLLCVVTFFLYFSAKIRFRLRFSWRSALLAAFLFVALGIGFISVLSVVLFSYFCEAVSYRRERRGLDRLSLNPNIGVGLIMVLALFVFPLLNEMYFRGTQAKILNPDYSRRNLFYEINENGFRGPKVLIERSGIPRLLFLGDSTAFGWPYRHEESFPFIVKSILNARRSDVEIVNAASVGQSVGQIRQQLPFFLEYKPDLVFLMTGVHYLRADKDFQRILEDGVSRDTRWRPFIVLPPMLIEICVFSLKTSPLFSTGNESKESAVEIESFKVHLRAVVQTIRDSGAQLYLVEYPTPGAERRVQDEIRRVARETGTSYIPLSELINSEKLRHDPIHPNRQGHRLIAEEIVRVAFDDRGQILPP